MLFRNATFFQFPSSLSFADFNEQLTECELKPVQGLELVTRGFVSPYGDESELMMQQQDKVIGVQVGQQEKLLPGAVVNEALQKKLRELEKKDGRRPGSKRRAQIKSDLILEMLPKAFVKSNQMSVMLDTASGWIAIDTASRKQAENAVSEVRRALSSFPALPLNAEVAPRQVLTQWISGENLPEGFVLGHEAELQDPAEQGATIKVARMELQSEEMQHHLEAGFQVTRLALLFNDRVSFVIGDDLVIRKLKLLEQAIESMDSGETEDANAERDARLALMHGELGELFAALSKAFKLSKVE